MKHIYIDGDQLSHKAIKKLIHQYRTFSENESAPATFLHFTNNDNQPQKHEILKQYRAFGVVGIEVPTKKQAADMMIIAYMQEQLTEHKFKKKDLEIALVTKDNILFSIAKKICMRYLVKIEQYDIEQVSDYFASSSVESRVT